MIFFFIKTTKHLDIRRDVKKFSPVGCCIDKLKKNSGYRQNKIHSMIKREVMFSISIVSTSSISNINTTPPHGSQYVCERT